MNLDASALHLANDPADFFRYSTDELGSIPRDEMEALQLAAVQQRFNELRDKIPVLKKLADKQGIEEIKELDDVIPLLFEHTIFKSYPKSFLEHYDFSKINTWLNKLSAHDLSSVEVSDCKSLDEWMDRMDEETPLRICHSSGTTGTMSFLPHSLDEWDALGRVLELTLIQTFGEVQSDEPIHVIYPYFRSGCAPMLRVNDWTVKYIARGEENFYAAYPSRMSSDMMYLAARVRHAQSKGTLDRLEVGGTLLARQEEFERIEADMPVRMQQFLDENFEKLKGRRIFTSGNWKLMYEMASKGLARGDEGIFSPDSIVLTGGGAKGLTPPDNWKEDVARYMGVDKVRMAYGMSEVFGHNRMCSEGRYHIVPWVIPFVLDPETSELLPRKGKVTGRAALFGLIARHAWGGFISGDEVTIDWDSQCPCGQTTYHLDPQIQRFSEKTGDDDKITCAATFDAHQDAMSFLSNLEH